MGCPPASDVGVVEMGVLMFVGLFVCLFLFFSSAEGLASLAGSPISGLDCLSSLRKRKPRKLIA